MMENRRNIYLLLMLTLLGVWGQALAQGNLMVSLSSTPACSTDGVITATVTGGTPPYTYHWHNPLYGNLTTTVPTRSGPSGIYSVTVNDASTGTGFGSIYLPSVMTTTFTKVDDVCNQGVGQVSVNVTGGTSPYSYLWSNGQVTNPAIGLNGGSYALTITDVNGCFKAAQYDSSMYAFVYNTGNLTGSVSSTASVCATGTASVNNVGNGTPPYSYQWSTIPPQFTQTATGLNAGIYQATVTDAVGCNRTFNVNVPQAPNGITATVTTTPESCISANGTATVTVVGGVLPLTYLWSNGATTQSLSGLSYGNYRVTVTDANGCIAVSGAPVHRTNPITLTLTTTLPNCANTGGALTANVTGGTGPYTYLWNTGATTQSITNLAGGAYYVEITDANGCYAYTSQLLQMSPTCFANLSGKLIRDANSNCVQNPGEGGFLNSIVDLGGGYWTTTNGAGSYQRNVPPGNYSVSVPSTPQFYNLGCPVGGTIPVTGAVAAGTYPNLDFFFQPAGIADDLEIWVHATHARPTDPQNVTIFYRNLGNTTLNPTLNFTHDALMTPLSLGGATYNSGIRTLTWNLPTLPPGGYNSRMCTFTIPTNTPFGTAYTHTAEILPIVGDVNPGNNSWMLNGAVVASYDPNDKQVTPAGMLAPGVDSILTYTIRFQNTGSDTAFTVAIRDTLDSDIDPFSIEILGASHSYIWDMDAPGYMTFTFDHIMLPDSHINEAASHGYVAYRARIKPNLPLGTEIKNTASIYFDYNAPVVTNTTLNTFGLVGTDPRQAADAGFTIHPNPTRGDVQIRLSEVWEGETEVSLMDLGGRKLRNWTVDALRAPSANLQLSGIPAGIYLLQCNDGIHQQVRKLVIQ